MNKKGEGKGGSINFVPLNGGGGGLLFEREGFIEDLQ